jgi:hypothetical protein
MEIPTNNMIDLSPTVSIILIPPLTFSPFYCHFSFIAIFGSMMETLKTVPNIVDNNK